MIKFERKRKLLNKYVCHPVKYVIGDVKESKKPLFSGWRDYEKTDIERLKKVVKKRGPINLGLQTGKKNNITVIDVDLPKEGSGFVDGLKEFNKLLRENTDYRTIREYLREEDITSQVTRSKKGYHLIYQYTDKLKSPISHVNGTTIDIRNDKGYILLAGSKCYNEELDEEVMYKWIVNLSKKDPKPMPEWLLNWLLKDPKSHNIKTEKKKSKKKASKTQSIVKTNNDLNDVDIRLQKYLNILKPIRSEAYDDWFLIGAVIYNEGGTFKLFHDWSKTAPNFDAKACKDKWREYEENREKKVLINTLFDLCKIDNKKAYLTCKRTDVIYNSDIVFKEGPNDYNIANLFYSIKPKKYVYDSDNNVLYLYNKYGIYEKIGARKGSLKIDISDVLISFFETQFKGRYRLLNNEILEACQDNKLKSIHKENKRKQAELIQMYTTIKNYIKRSKNIKTIADDVCDLYTVPNLNSLIDRTIGVIPFNNGVYDLSTHKFRKGERDEYFTKTVKYNYKEVDDEYIKLIDEIINPIFNVDAERDYVMKSLASAMTGKNAEEEYYMWLGGGGNGKGIIDKLLQCTFGHKYATLDINYFMQKSYDPTAPNSALAKAASALFVMVNEPPDGTKINETILNKMTGGDKLVTRDLYEKAKSFTAMFKLFFLSNNEIEINGGTNGVKRRFRLVNFRNTFVKNPKHKHQKKIDMTLKTKINSDIKYRQAFFSLLVKYHKMYVKDGLTQPKEFKQETDDYVKDYDPIQKFLDECIVITDDKKDFVSTTELFNEYKYFTDGNIKKINSNNFKRALMQKGLQVKRRKNKRGFIGIKMNIDENE